MTQIALPLPFPSPLRPIDEVMSDISFVEKLTEAVKKAEVDGLNDFNASEFRRSGHRGQRAEQQALDWLGKAFKPYGGEWEQETGQCRFFFSDRYSKPVRFIYCRGTIKQDGTTFRICVKGNRTKELIAENRLQLQLFPRPGSTKTNPTEKTTNLWIVADTSGNDFTVYLANSIDIIRPWYDKAEMWHENLLCSEVRLAWQGILIDPQVSDSDKPGPVKLGDPLLGEIDEPGEDNTQSGNSQQITP